MPYVVQGRPKLCRFVLMKNHQGQVTVERLVTLLQASEPAPAKAAVSGGTKSNAGRDCRDTFLGLAKTCGKPSIAFWDYLGDRLHVPASLPIPDLPGLIRCRSQPA